MVVDIIRLEDGLVKYRDTFPKGPAAFFADVTQETYVAKNAIYILQTLLADGVVVGSNFVCQLEILLAYWNVFSEKKRFIVVTSSGSLSQLLSYQACCGAAPQVRSHHDQEVVCSDVTPKLLDSMGSTGLHKPLAIPGTYLPRRQDNGSRHSFPRHLQPIY